MTAPGGPPGPSRRALVAGLGALGLAGCRVEFGPPGAGRATSPGTGGTLWIYTSMYQSVVESLKPLLLGRFPDLDVRFFQGGSEKVVQRIEAEWAAGGSPADLVLTSDPFWYEQARLDGRLLRYTSPEALRIPREFLDLHGYWATSRLSAMVLAVNADRVPPAERPRTFADLADPRFRGRASMGDPLSSGTHLTLLAFLHHRYGWDLYRRLRANDVVAAGGNSAVMTRIESGERPVGALLLENLLLGRKNGTPATMVLPEDGVVLVPGPIAILAGAPNPGAARAVYDVLLSPDGQREMVRGHMYSPRPDVGPPEGAPALGGFTVQPWSDGLLAEVVAGKADLVRDYAAVMEGRAPAPAPPSRAAGTPG